MYPAEFSLAIISSFNVLIIIKRSTNAGWTLGIALVASSGSNKDLILKSSSIRPEFSSGELILPDMDIVRAPSATNRRVASLIGVIDTRNSAAKPLMVNIFPGPISPNIIR